MKCFICTVGGLHSWPSPIVDQGVSRLSGCRGHRDKWGCICLWLTSALSEWVWRVAGQSLWNLAMFEIILTYCIVPAKWTIKYSIFSRLFTLKYTQASQPCVHYMTEWITTLLVRGHAPYSEILGNRVYIHTLKSTYKVGTHYMHTKQNIWFAC